MSVLKCGKVHSFCTCEKKWISHFKYDQNFKFRPTLRIKTWKKLYKMLIGINFGPDFLEFIRLSRTNSKLYIKQINAMLMRVLGCTIPIYIALFWFTVRLNSSRLLLFKYILLYCIYQAKFAPGFFFSKSALFLHRTTFLQAFFLARM